MIINVTVVTGSFEETIKKLPDGSYKIRMKEQPIKGLANQKTIEIVANHFAVPKINVKIKFGFRSRHKIVEISN